MSYILIKFDNSNASSFLQLGFNVLGCQPDTIFYLKHNAGNISQADHLLGCFLSKVLESQAVGFFWQLQSELATLSMKL